jgi:histidinol-phosphatase
MASSPSLDDDLALAHRLADLATEVAVPFYERGVETIVKEDNSPVSEADLEVDRRLVEALRQERPEDAILSEESGEHGASNRRWILDPIDGTFNFVEQRPAWGSHVALEVDGEIVLGVITRPVYERRWYATLGGGAFTSDASGRNARRLQVSTTSDLAQCRICVWSHHSDEQLEVWRREFVLVRPSSLDNILQVAEGELDAVIESRGMIWDHAPALLLVHEAGGTFRDPEGGRRPDLGTSRYTNGRIDAALHQLLSH